MAKRIRIRSREDLMTLPAGGIFTSDSNNRYLLLGDGETVRFYRHDRTDEGLVRCSRDYLATYVKGWVEYDD